MNCEPSLDLLHASPLITHARRHFGQAFPPKTVRHRELSDAYGNHPICQARNPCSDVRTLHCGALVQFKPVRTKVQSRQRFDKEGRELQVGTDARRAEWVTSSIPLPQIIFLRVLPWTDW